MAMKTKGQTADLRQPATGTSLREETSHGGARRWSKVKVKELLLPACLPAGLQRIKSCNIVPERLIIIVDVVSTNHKTWAWSFSPALLSAHSSSTSVAYHSSLRVKEAEPPTRSSPQLFTFARR